jgi:hypothetical protein
MSVKNLCCTVYDFEDFSVVYSSELKSQVRHNHRDLEVALLLSSTPAQIQWWTDDQLQSRSLQPQQVCLIPPQHNHAILTPEPIELLMFHFQSASLLRIAQQMKINSPIEWFAQYAIADQLIWQLGITFYQELEHSSSKSWVYLDQLKTCLLMRLLKQYSSSVFTEEPEASPCLRSLDADWAEAQL